ncbi:MAG: hypothetical protein VX884_00010 [Pseudomonadota bacterium]|nr:hypothetical protein [Pseudomonadota bacterium]
MKSVVTLVLLFCVTTPVYAGEMDGKGLECTFVENPLNFGPKYYLFENGKVVQPYVDDSIPLSIKREIYQDDYVATASAIVWSTSYTFDRKTLKLSVSMGMETQKYYCQVMTPEEIESILQKQIEALKEE